VRILITGGAGYLGSILSKKLLDEGNQVSVFDALWYGKEPIKDCLNNNNFTLINEDIRNLIPTVKALKDDIDAVIHLASVVGMPASSIEPKMSEEINYLATKNIAELCELHGIDTFLFSSTCSVYGEQGNNLITEKSKVNPIDYYAKSKWQSERAIQYLNHAPTILRFGTLFGISPRLRFDLVVNVFIIQALFEGKITVNGGEQYRPFLHVEDAADSLIFALKKNLTGVYNVISKNIKIIEVAELISKLSGCEINITQENPDKRNYKVSADKIKSMGFDPKHTIEESFYNFKEKVDSGEIKNYKDAKYSNYKQLFESKEIR
jgi:nucleoside-diphosphate-sugar epimerase